MCWIIPLIVGVISAILGYLLGRRCCENSQQFVGLRNDNEDLKRKLNLCEKRFQAQYGEDHVINLGNHNTVETGKAKNNDKDTANTNHHNKAEMTGSDSGRVAADTEKSTTFDADLAKSIFGKKIKQDDLTLVEGIGEKICQLFHEADIKTWQNLADTSPERCREILAATGPRFATHNPQTWPRQAKLPAEGKWLELLDWQNKLDGGREV